MPDPSDLAPETKKIGDLVVSPVWTILAKGFSGTGKTVFGCGKEFRPVYVFDFEGRMESVATFYKADLKDIYYNHFPLTEGFYKIDKKMDAIVARPEFKTVIASSLTSFIRNVLVHLKRTSVERAGEGGRTKGVRKKGGIQANILEDFNFEDAAIIDELIGFFQILKSQGVNVILEAHITPYEIKTINEDTGDRDLQTIMEILTKGKKAPAEVPGWFNEVWLFEKVTGQQWDSAPTYRINTKGNAASSCKTSFNIPSFDWTGKDGSIELMKHLSGDIKDNPRVDPSLPKVKSW